MKYFNVMVWTESKIQGLRVSALKVGRETAWEAIELIGRNYPDLPVIGVEPAREPLGSRL